MKLGEFGRAMGHIFKLEVEGLFVRVLIPMVLTTLQHRVGYMESFVSIFGVCVECQLRVPVSISSLKLVS